MEGGSLSVVAERGQSQLEGTIAAARNVLSHFAIDLASDSDRSGDRQHVGPDAEFNVQSFLTAKDMYLACSQGLRETIKDIGGRRKDSGNAMALGTSILDFLPAELIDPVIHQVHILIFS